MRAKYRFSSWLNPGKKHYTSALWRRIRKEGISVTLNSSMLIANRRRINIWNDPWVPGTILGCSGLTFNINGPGTISLLQHLLPDQQWDYGRIAFFLGGGIAHLVASTGIPIRSQLAADCWAWGEKESPNLKVMDFYLGLHVSDPSSARLAKVWQINCPEMVKLMIWKALMGKLPTRCFLSSFGFSDGMCARCPAVLEDLDHLFFLCPFAATVWHKVLERISVVIRIPSIPSLRDFLLMNPREAEWGLKASITVITIWHIWCAHNRLSFDGKVLSPTSVCLNSLAMAELHAFPLMLAVGAERRLVGGLTDSGWYPPPPGFIKLNYAGAWHPLSSSGMGFILRDAACKTILAGGRQVAVASHLFANIHAAAWALHELSSRLGDSLANVDIILESDSATAADWLAGNGGTSHPTLLSARHTLRRFRCANVTVCSSVAGLLSWRMAEAGRLTDSLIPQLKVKISNADVRGSTL